MMTSNNEQRRRFGRTGSNVSPICLGTSNWGPLRKGETPAERDARISDLARDFFGASWPSSFLDTSNIYGESEAEALIGRSLAAEGGLPEGFVLQTKLDRDLATGDFGSDQMWRSVEQSLQRLGVSSVDVLFLHDPADFGFERSMAPGGPVSALTSMREQGIARSIGISDGPVSVLTSFVETDAFDALITHNRYTLVDRSAGALIDLATQRDMGVCNAAPYGGGVLTGDPRFADRYGYLPISPVVDGAVKAMHAVCREAGVPLAAAALQFSLRDPRIHSTIVGASSRDRFDEAIGHSALAIPDDVWRAIDDLVPDTSLDEALRLMRQRNSPC